MPSRSSFNSNSSSRWLRLALGLVVIGVVLWSRLGKEQRNEQRPAPVDVPAPVVRPTDPTPPAPEEAEERGPTAASTSVKRNAVGWNVGGGKLQVDGTVVSYVTVRDQSGRVQVQGEVDLAETLSRIDANRRLKQFTNDG